jgi:phage terminase small subunit
MRSRGRRSAAEQATVIIGEFGKRPDPPDYLTERQAEIWRETAASEPIDFFNTAALRGLLADYCRHRQAVEEISAIIDSFKPEWLKNGEGVKRYQALLGIRETETRASMSMARSLRLTNQSRYMPRGAARAGLNASGPKPWDV